MEEKVVHTVCPLGGDHTYCILKVHVKGGRIEKAESTDLPQCADDRCICPRGLSSPRWVYHPARLQYPLKRVGPRGGGQWQRISWEEALDEVARRLLGVKEKYGAQAVHVRSWGSSSVGLLGKLMGDRFASCWGASVFEAKGWFADGGMPAASLMVLGDSGQGHDLDDYTSSKMLVLWGWNPAETSLREMKAVLDVRERGAKLVVVGPLFNATAAKADQWVALRLGTDAALALGLLNVIIEERLYHQDYISSHTVGPFLVRKDTRRFLRERDVGGTSDGFMVFDRNAGAATSLSNPQAKPALLGDFIVGGLPCKPAFQLLAERAAEYSPERASELTGVPAETIRRLAVEYATARPAAMRMSYGQARTYHSSMACRAIITLGALTGNIGISGGGVSTSALESGYTVGLNTAAVTRPPGAPGTRDIPGTTNNFQGWTTIRDEKPYPVKALIIRYQNPVHNYGNESGYRDIFSRMELVTVWDTFMSPTARYADIVLPETTVFEQSDLQVSRYHLVRMQKAIEPLYEARPAFEIWADLARRVGLGHYFRQTEEEVISTLLDSEHPSVAGITLEQLEKEIAVKARVPPVPRMAFGDKKFPTPSGRIEFYVERLAELGEELPAHEEHLESPRASALAERYPLSIFTVKRKTRTQSITPCDWVVEIEGEPALELNPADAARRQIQDGETVEVFNDRGRVKLKVRLTETVPPGAVNLAHGWLPESTEGHYNSLLFRVDDPQQINPALDIEPIISDSRAGMHTLQYDCLVEVRRA